MKFLYLATCCMILSSHNFYAASEINAQDLRLESDWLTADKDGNSKEIEEKIIPTISKNDESNTHEINDANDTPDQKIITDIDEMVTSVCTTWNSIYANIINMFTDDDNDI